MGWRVYLDLPSCVFSYETRFSIIFEVYVWLQECNPPIRSHHPLGSVKLGKSHNFTHWKWNFDEVWEILKCENLKQNWGFSFSLPLGLFCFHHGTSLARPPFRFGRCADAHASATAFALQSWPWHIHSAFVCECLWWVYNSSAVQEAKNTHWSLRP